LADGSFHQGFKNGQPDTMVALDTFRLSKDSSDRSLFSAQVGGGGAIRSAISPADQSNINGLRLSTVRNASGEQVRLSGDMDNQQAAAILATLGADKNNITALIVDPTGKQTQPVVIVSDGKKSIAIVSKNAVQSVSVIAGALTTAQVDVENADSTQRILFAGLTATPKAGSEDKKDDGRAPNVVGAVPGADGSTILVAGTANQIQAGLQNQETRDAVTGYDEAITMADGGKARLRHAGSGFEYHGVLGYLQDEIADAKKGNRPLLGDERDRDLAKKGDDGLTKALTSASQTGISKLFFNINPDFSLSYDMGSNDFTLLG
jgi:hypothetical protein